MKQYMLMAAAMASIAAALPAQNIIDATRYGSTQIMGSARYNAMAGAFGALGGDLSCMNDNPAGMAIYRGTNSFTITPRLSFVGTSSRGTEKVSRSDNDFAISNLGTVFSFRNEDGGSLVNFNLGIGFSRNYTNHSQLNVINDGTRNTFSQYLTARANDYLKTLTKPNVSDAFDWDNPYTTAPFLTMLGAEVAAFDINDANTSRVINHFNGWEGYQALYMRERTRQDNYNISASMNFDDQFYVGATLVITDYNSTISTEMDENYTYDLDGSYLAFDNNVETKGSGVGVNLGFIWNPIDNWRIGAAIHTPTWNKMKEFLDGGMMTYDYSEDINYGWDSYNDSWNYRFSTPWEYQFSAAYIIGTKGLISLEYDLRDFTTMRYYNEDSNGYSGFDFSSYNQAIKDYMQAQHTIKVGAEYRLSDQVSLRAGYAHVTSPYKDDALNARIPSNRQSAAYNSTLKTNFTTQGDQNYITCGLGWRGENWFADLSFMYHVMATKVAINPADAYNDLNQFSNPVVCEQFDVDVNTKNFDLTIGYRF